MTWRAVTAVAASTLVLAAPIAARERVVPTGNLIQNPGAEDSPGAIDDTVVRPIGWNTAGALTAWAYPSAENDRPPASVSATIGGGTTFFSGGPGGVPGRPVASQTIDVSGASEEIDAGTVAATLSAFIGGYTVSNDLAQVDAVFYDAAATRLGSLRIGPVTRDDRSRLTTLLRRSGVKGVPIGTRRIDVVISVEVDNNGKNQAYVDNVSLTLAAAPAVAPRRGAVLTLRCAAGTLTATVKPAPGSTVTSVVFSAGGRALAIDKKAPFVVKAPTTGLAARVTVSARVTASGKKATLTSSIERC